MSAEVASDTRIEAGTGSRTLRIGTRGSLLATTQAGTVRDALIAAGHPAELVVITTKGDVTAGPVERIGVGVFTAELREALLAGDVDLAVHSYKDLPTAQDPRLVIAAVPPREDPRDALVARDGLVLGELPPGSRVGTSAPRRRAQLAAMGLGLDIRPLRGNIDTRLGKVASGELDAIVIARAGLSRIGRLDRITESLEPVQMLPAPSQGALAVECRAEDTALIEILAGLDDRASRAAVVAERALLATRGRLHRPRRGRCRGRRIPRRRRPRDRGTVRARLRRRPRRLGCAARERRRRHRPRGGTGPGGGSRVARSRCA